MSPAHCANFPIDKREVVLPGRRFALTEKERQLVAAVDRSLCWQSVIKQGGKCGQEIVDRHHLVALANRHLTRPAHDAGHAQRALQHITHLTSKRACGATEKIVVLALIGDWAVVRDIDDHRVVANASVINGI